MYFKMFSFSINKPNPASKWKQKGTRTVVKMIWSWKRWLQEKMFKINVQKTWIFWVCRLCISIVLRLVITEFEPPSLQIESLLVLKFLVFFTILGPTCFVWNTRMTSISNRYDYKPLTGSKLLLLLLWMIYNNLINNDSSLKLFRASLIKVVCNNCCFSTLKCYTIDHYLCTIVHSLHRGKNALAFSGFGNDDTMSISTRKTNWYQKCRLNYSNSAY